LVIYDVIGVIPAPVGIVPVAIVGAGVGYDVVSVGGGDDVVIIIAAALGLVVSVVPSLVSVVAGVGVGGGVGIGGVSAAVVVVAVRCDRRRLSFSSNCCFVR